VTMPRQLSVLALTGLLIAAVGEARAIGPTAIAAVDDVIDAPRVLFGETAEQIERTLGAPTSRRADGEELVYPGVVLRVHKGRRLVGIRVTDPRYALPTGLRVGASRTDVEAALGEAQQMTDERYLYLYSDGFPKTVEFYFTDNRVRRIEWTYWVE
jgi:hypothetical protein